MKTLLVCALYLEAKPFIQTFQLKPVQTLASFQVFEGDSYALIISGIGKAASAAATSFLVALYPYAQGVINVGICGGRGKKVGDMFLIDQIIDNDSERSFYPDVIGSQLERSSLMTLSQADTQQNFECLVDMEASGFFESASYFFPAHAIQVIKVVSDNADTNTLDKGKVEEILENLVGAVSQASFNVENSIGLSKDEEKAIQEFLEYYTFSVTQQRDFYKNIWSLKIQSEDSIQIILDKLFLNLKEGDNKKHIAEKTLKELQGLLKKY